MLGSCHCTALLFVGAIIFSSVAAGACGPSEREVYVGGRWGCIPAATAPSGSTGEPVGGGAPGSVPSPVPYPPRAEPLPGVTAELWRDIKGLPSDPWIGARPAVFTYVLSGDSGKLCAMSRPRRESSRMCFPCLTISTRKPSYLSSNSQPERVKGLPIAVHSIRS